MVWLPALGRQKQILGPASSVSDGFQTTEFVSETEWITGMIPEIVSGH